MVVEILLPTESRAMSPEPESSPLFEHRDCRPRVRGLLQTGKQHVNVVRHEAVNGNGTSVFLHGGAQQGDECCHDFTVDEQCGPFGNTKCKHHVDLPTVRVAWQ